MTNFSKMLFHQYRIITYNKYMKKFGGGVLHNKEGYLLLHEGYNYSTLSTRNYGNKISTNVKLHLSSRINPP